jgi:isopentenyldiphosphate isomerase
VVEYFDLFDQDGRPLGTSKPRDQVHRDGDWHRSIALWIVRQSGSIVFQQRSLLKDTRPGLFTASVSGHYAAGEDLKDVLREAVEEIGVVASESDLIPLGCRQIDDRPAPERIDRELQDVFLWPLERPLTDFSPDAREVSGLADIAAGSFLELLGGRQDTVAADFRAAESQTVERRSLRLADFVPLHQYHLWVARAALDFVSRNGKPV